MRTVGRIFVEAHRDAWRLLLQQWPAIVIIAATSLATTEGGNFARPYVHLHAAQLMVDELFEIAGLWITAPAMVALYRYLILDEASDPSPLSRTAMTGTYFNAAAVLSLMLTFTALIAELKFAVSPSVFGKSAPAITNLGVTFIVMMRLATFLPGVAVGRNSRSFGVAFVESKGHSVLIVATYVATLGPVFLMNLGLVALLPNVPRWKLSLILEFTGLPLLLVGTAVAALIYQHLRRGDLETTFRPAGFRPPSQPFGTNPPREPRQTFGRLTYQQHPAFSEPAAAEGPSHNQLTVFGIARAAYGDLVNIARQMWPVLLIISMMYFVCAMTWFIAPIFVSSWVGRMVLRMLIFIGVAWLTAPYYIALHRFVSTGEVQWIPPREMYGRASAVYFAWAAMTVVLWFLPLILGNTVDAFVPNYATLTSLVTYIIVFIVMVRMTTLLPAAALAPERASWAQAMDDSSGRFRLFLGSTTGAALPAILLTIFLGRAAGSQTITALPFFALAVPALLVMQLIPLAAGTRLYEALPRESSISRLDQVLRQR